MRVIPTRVHGMVDYIVGALLIVAPWLFGFADGGAEQWVPIILGAGVILYSLMTDYELGVMKAIPMSMHLMLDIGGGIFLAVSPWLFGFADEIWWPHVIVGLGEILAGLMTKTRPEYDHAGTGRGTVKGQNAKPAQQEGRSVWDAPLCYSASPADQATAEYRGRQHIAPSGLSPLAMPIPSSASIPIGERGMVTGAVPLAVSPAPVNPGALHVHALVWQCKAAPWHKF